MKTNIGINDKMIRMILAAICAILAFNVHFAFGIVSIILMATVILSWCPILQAMGKNTCSLKEA